MTPVLTGKLAGAAKRARTEVQAELADARTPVEGLEGKADVLEAERD